MNNKIQSGKVDSAAKTHPAVYKIVEPDEIIVKKNSHEALLDTLILALPYIETLADDPGYKPESIKNFVKKIHNVLAQAEGK
jgi:hypothetical protein